MVFYPSDAFVVLPRFTSWPLPTLSGGLLNRRLGWGTLRLPPMASATRCPVPSSFYGLGIGGHAGVGAGRFSSFKVYSMAAEQSKNYNAMVIGIVVVVVGIGCMIVAGNFGGTANKTSGPVGGEDSSNNSAEAGSVDEEALTDILTAEVAKQILEAPVSPSLIGFTELGRGAAEVLSEYSGELDLRGLTSLSDAQAEILSKHDGVLRVDDDKLPSSAAEIIRRSRDSSGLRKRLRLLPDISFPDERVMEAESAVPSPPLTESNERAPKVLTVGIARKLPKGEFLLRLTEYTQIEDQAAAILSKLNCELYLDGLTEISDAAAESLANHQGLVLGLNGLTELSDSQAESLARHKWFTLPAGLPVTGDLKGSMIFLGGLTTLSDEGAKSLAKKQGRIVVDHAKLPPSASKILKDAGH